MNAAITPPVIVELVFMRRLKPKECVTERDQLKHWHFEWEKFKAEVEFESVYVWPVLHVCKITGKFYADRNHIVNASLKKFLDPQEC